MLQLSGMFLRREITAIVSTYEFQIMFCPSDRPLNLGGTNTTVAYFLLWFLQNRKRTYN